MTIQQKISELRTLTTEPTEFNAKVNVKLDQAELWLTVPATAKADRIAELEGYLDKASSDCCKKAIDMKLQVVKIRSASGLARIETDRLLAEVEASLRGRA